MCLELSSDNRHFLRLSSRTVLLICLASFQEGYIFSEITFLYYIIYYNTTKGQDNWLPLFTSLFLYGAMVGALLPTPLVNKTSRKRALLIAHAALVPGTLLLSIAWFPLMVFLSFLQGVFVGCLSTLAPLLLYQIAKQEVRGIMVTYHQVFVSFAIALHCLLAYCVLEYTGLTSTEQLETNIKFKVGWRLVISLPAIVGVVAFIIIYLKFPEKQPVELLSESNHFQFQLAADALGHSKQSASQLQDELVFQEQKDLRHPRFCRSLCLCIFLSFVEIVSAYQALLLYGVKLIYIELSPENPLELKPSFYKINIQTGTNLLAALAAIIFIIDRISRKINLLGGLLAIFPTLVYLFLFIVFSDEVDYPDPDTKEKIDNLINWRITFVCFVVIFYEISIGSSNRVIFAELLPRRHFAIANCTNWGFAAVVAFSTAYVKGESGYLFMGYALALSIAFIATCYLLIDTLGLPRIVMYTRIQKAFQSIGASPSHIDMNTSEVLIEEGESGVFEFSSDNQRSTFGGRS